MAFPTNIETLKSTWIPWETRWGHANHHNDISLLLERIQNTIGINSSTVPTSIAYRLANLESSVVIKTTDQVIWGVKTFSASPIIPTPTTDFQAATKKYVDDKKTYLKKSTTMAWTTKTVTDADVTTDCGIVWTANTEPVGYIKINVNNGNIVFTSTASETCTITYYILK